jgi:hypothetical protein
LDVCAAAGDASASRIMNASVNLATFILAAADLNFHFPFSICLCVSLRAPSGSSNDEWEMEILQNLCLIA